MGNTESILDSIKKLSGIDCEDTHFDPDLIMHINTVFMMLRQMGVGPQSGFVIADNTATWTDYSEDIDKLAAVKSYVYLKTRLVFDPPQSTSVIDAFNETIRELEWRLNSEVDYPVE